MKTDIEYAAMVMGEGFHVRSGAVFVDHKGSPWSPQWEPLDDDGDSRRLEIACNKWTNINGADTVCDAHWNYVDSWDEWNPQAIRAAVFELAVAIGKVIDGGGV